MNTRELSIPLPGDQSAVLILPQPLSEPALQHLEQALSSTLHALHSDQPQPADPGALEYASWFQQVLAARASIT